MAITYIALGLYKQSALLLLNLPLGEALIVHNAKIQAIISGILLRMLIVCQNLIFSVMDYLENSFYIFNISLSSLY